MSLARLQAKVEQTIVRLGILFRVFGRPKTEDSVRRKIETKGYAHGGRLLQDLIGVRVIVYFAEDCTIVQRAIRKHFDIVDETVDVPETDEFGPRRLNLVLRAPADMWDVQVGELPVDTTFELQIRTALSEGWHEVEHDLRYKCAADWTAVPDKLRTLNGTLAAIETAEWAMGRLLDGLAYHHYKSRQWEPMLRHKFRLRVQTDRPLSDAIRALLDQDDALAKRLWRADRAKFIETVASSTIALPWTFDNLVHLVCASDGIDHADLRALRPAFVAQRIDEEFGNV